jgi:hypothetical protein
MASKLVEMGYLGCTSVATAALVPSELGAPPWLSTMYQNSKWQQIRLAK